MEEYQILKARFQGLKESMQLQYHKIPNRIESTYRQKILNAQEQSKKIYNTWHELEKEFTLMKLDGFKDKFRKAVLKQKRKMLRLEYASVLNSLTVLLLSIKSGNYIQG